MEQTCLQQTCAALCSRVYFTPDHNVTSLYCQSYTKGTVITAPAGQIAASCGSNFTAPVDLCRISLNVGTSSTTSTYMEAWLPDQETNQWNGRTMSTGSDNLDGCINYDTMQYVAGMGFAAIGDDSGHNSSSTDGSWMLNNNEAILDWVYRARHASISVAKQAVGQFYNSNITASYYLGCSVGGQQGVRLAQQYPDDFDGIIAGSPTLDWNHLQDWSSRFVQLVGQAGSNALTSLNEGQWLAMQAQVLAQCDQAIDGVADGILEDPSLCKFNPAVLGLQPAQAMGLSNVFANLIDYSNRLLFPALQYGAAYDSYRIGLIAGAIQITARDWFRNAVYNDSSWDPLGVNINDFVNADSTDVLHGGISTFSGDLTGLRAAGKKLMLYHGMADPLVPGTNTQRYYLKVAKTMGLTSSQIDPFMRFYRISGMAHCGRGGINGAGAWMFGQTKQASIGVDNIINRMVDWVEKGQAPDTITGTKYYYDVPDLGVQFTRPHCRFPYRTTFVGGDWTKSSSWNCTYISNWQNCGSNAQPRLCNNDGTFV